MLANVDGKAMLACVPMTVVAIVACFWPLVKLFKLPDLLDADGDVAAAASCAAGAAM